MATGWLKEPETFGHPVCLVVIGGVVMIIRLLRRLIAVARCSGAPWNWQDWQ